MDRKSLEAVRPRIEAVLTEILRKLDTSQADPVKVFTSLVADEFVKLYLQGLLTVQAVEGVNQNMVLEVEKFSRSAVLLFERGTPNQTLMGASVDMTREKPLWEDDQLVLVDNRFRVEPFTIDQVSFASQDEAELVEEVVERAA